MLTDTKTHGSGASHSPGTPPPIDGRTARRDRNKMAVLDAVIDLFAGGNLTPGVHEVAERSQVSLRSVYRYFSDVDDLIAAAIDRHLDHVQPLFQLPRSDDGSARARIATFCRRRVALYVEMREVHLASVIRATDQPQIARTLERSRQRLADQTRSFFAEDLDRLRSARSETAAAMLDSLSQFEAIEHLFANHGHDPDTASAHLEDAFTLVLDCSAAA